MAEPNNPETSAEAPKDFIRDIVRDDLQSGAHTKIVTRFPPEPNGCLHIGHAKPICLNFGIAQEFGGVCHLRMDDTNPSGERAEFVDWIQEDIQWLGFDWEDRLYFASDYFGKLYEMALEMIRQGKAFVCDLTHKELEAHRGTPTRPGKESPYRDRSVEENLDLFQRMRAGEFKDGERTLRAKVDMASPNMHMRDPILYRIKRETHHRTGAEWLIYPTYDYTHCLSDAIEHITHSLCSLEFEAHRPIYDWIVDNAPSPSKPRQIEFSRLAFTYTVLSKRKLKALIDAGQVTGWDDPRMPTLRGLRRRGYSPEAIKSLIRELGVTKYVGVNDFSRLEQALRQDLNQRALRRIAVLDPIKVVITNYPEGQTEELSAVNNPEDPEAGSRPIHFGRELWIDRDDFMEDPPKKFFRLAPGQEVRLKYAYFIRCEEVVKDDAGHIIELRCAYDPETKSGTGPAPRKVKGTIHWISCDDCVEAEVRLYDRLLSVEDPGEVEEITDCVNPKSLVVRSNAKVEPALKDANVGDYLQFERVGYFCVDSVDSTPDHLVFNRSVSLKDSWAKAKG